MYGILLSKQTYSSPLACLFPAPPACCLSSARRAESPLPGHAHTDLDADLHVHRYPFANLHPLADSHFHAHGNAFTDGDLYRHPFADGNLYGDLDQHASSAADPATPAACSALWLGLCQSGDCAGQWGTHSARPNTPFGEFCLDV